MLLTIAELAAGLASILGAVSYMFVQLVWLLQTGIALSALALLFIFVGQRVAKDYASAANTIAYIAAAMLAWYIVSK